MAIRNPKQTVRQRTFPTKTEKLRFDRKRKNIIRERRQKRLKDKPFISPKKAPRVG